MSMPGQCAARSTAAVTMTCIVAIEHEGRVRMGADTQASAGWHQTARRDAKIFQLGLAVVGFTSSYRMGQIVQYLTPSPSLSRKRGERYLNDEPHEAMVRWASGALRTAFKENGYTRIDNNREDGGTFIVGFKGRIFVIQDDFQVSEPSDGFASVGCGSSYALGALHVIERSSLDLSVPMRLTHALEAATRFSNGVGGPYTYEDEPEPPAKKPSRR